MNEAFDDLLRAMKRARDALYNGFEPDNQSRAYHDADEAIKVADLARPLDSGHRSYDPCVCGLPDPFHCVREWCLFGRSQRKQTAPLPNTRSSE